MANIDKKLEEAIKDGINNYIAERMSQEFDTAIAMMQARKTEMIQAAVLKVAKMYEVQYAHERVVITVLKDDVDGGKK